MDVNTTKEEIRKVVEVKIVFAGRKDAQVYMLARSEAETLRDTIIDPEVTWFTFKPHNYLRPVSVNKNMICKIVW